MHALDSFAFSDGHIENIFIADDYVNLRFIRWDQTIYNFIFKPSYDILINNALGSPVDYVSWEAAKPNEHFLQQSLSEQRYGDRCPFLIRFFSSWNHRQILLIAAEHVLIVPAEDNEHITIEPIEAL